ATLLANLSQPALATARHLSADTCHHIQYSNVDSSLRRVLASARIPFFHDPKDRDSVRVGEAPAGYLRLTLSDPRPFPSVVVAWMPGLADAHVVAVLAEGCVWHPEARSTGFGVK